MSLSVSHILTQTNTCHLALVTKAHRPILDTHIKTHKNKCKHFAVGPDGISNRVLKELSREVSPALCGFFNQSLHTGIVPDSFKQAYVSPVHKGGDPSEISNYRPISLLSNLDKAFERLIFKYVYNHFLENNILTSFQSGFRRGDSTVNQLSYLYNTFCQALDAGKEVRAIFCDISKAFDPVWHVGIIHKLKSAGISGNLLSWFTNYLTGRKQSC